MYIFEHFLRYMGYFSAETHRPEAGVVVSAMKERPGIDPWPKT
jgi:hypothetical protein